MQDVGIVRGSAEQAQPAVVSKDLVYIHTNIKKISITDEITGEERIEYEYNEVQYDKDEYIQKMIMDNSELQQQIVDTQLALCDLYEGGSLNG